MPFRKYTQCYVHTPGDKPFNKADLVGLALLHGVLPGALFGAIAGLAAGFLVGGPIGAVVGLIVGFFSAITVGVSLALTETSQKWRFHRLVCLSGVQCAVGLVREQPTRGDLGQFDNDQFFDLQLMPHPLGEPFEVKGSERKNFTFDYSGQSENYRVNLPAPVLGDDANKIISKFPKNDVFTDQLQGTKLVRPTLSGTTPGGDLPYDTTNNWLHCEAEGDFWVRMSDLALALGALVAALAVVTVAAGYAGAAAGASYGCSIGSIFGPIGCLIGGIIGAIAGALLAGGAAGAVGSAIVQGILNAIFNTTPGEVEDANIGDKAFGAISAGDAVVVYGEHVYDGFHAGWHEIHPLMAVIKLADAKVGRESLFYLQWTPGFKDSDQRPDDLPGMPSAPPDQDITNIQADDMRRGLDSTKFALRVGWLRNRWCDKLTEAFDPAVRQAQQGLSQRWTIHPSVDGCVPRDREPDPVPIR